MTGRNILINAYKDDIWITQIMFTLISPKVFIFVLKAQHSFNLFYFCVCSLYIGNALIFPVFPVG